MASLDEIFYKEFNGMMYQLRGINGTINLEDIPLPDTILWSVEHREKAVIDGIEDEYYGRLNGEELLLWGNKALNRRKFDHSGEFIKDKEGNFILEEVTCPSECVAVLSERSIGVPYKYKPQLPFQYVDLVQKTLDNGEVLTKYIYLIPKQFVYKMNQAALVLSWNKLRVFYSGVSLSLQNGHLLFVYVIPYRVSNVEHNYRVISTKTTDDFGEEMEALRDFWVENNIMFNPNDCVLTDYVRGRENMAYESFDGVLDMFERLKTGKPISSDLVEEEFDYV